MLENAQVLQPLSSDRGNQSREAVGLLDLIAAWNRGSGGWWMSTPSPLALRNAHLHSLSLT
jgi:hypothetical protein